MISQVESQRWVRTSQRIAELNEQPKMKISDIKESSKLSIQNFSDEDDEIFENKVLYNYNYIIKQILV